jgi:hypothetical protein
MKIADTIEQDRGIYYYFGHGNQVVSVHLGKKE